MKPVDFPESNVVFAKDQPEYLPLPAYTSGGRVVSCWHLSWRERFKLLFTGRVWLLVLTFGSPLQPQRVEADSPFEEEVT